jgi:thiosulfate dehydrogenase
MVRRLVILAGVLLLLVAACGDSEEGDAIAGGLSYDKWWKVVDADEPDADHPLWATQTTNERSGSTTWRCKECHGWDYKGAAGAYGSGSHFTGFSGIFDTQDKSADDLTGAMTGDIADHDFSDLFSDDDVANIVAFIRGGLDDYGQFIADDKTVTGGDLGNGETLYESICTVCHGGDGTTMNFGDADDPVYIGTVALDNPWEFFHKVKYGQPASAMPNATDNDLTLEDIRDIVAYSQSFGK